MSINSATRSHSPVLLRLALGYIYLHFGLLKFFPDLSPAELIATQTVMALSGNMLDATTSLYYLALLETAIGLGFIFNLFPRCVFGLFTFHMCGTILPLFFLPEFTFKIAPFAPNIEGQYIFKNIVYFAAGWTVLKPELFPAKHSVEATSTLHVANPSQTKVRHETVLT